MTYTEAAFSVEQLLGFKVCIDFPNITQPPRLFFESIGRRGTLGITSGQTSGTFIKFETANSTTTGHCVLRFYALNRAGNDGPDASTPDLQGMLQPHTNCTFSVGSSPRATGYGYDEENSYSSPKVFHQPPGNDSRHCLEGPKAEDIDHFAMPYHCLSPVWSPLTHVSHPMQDSAANISPVQACMLPDPPMVLTGFPDEGHFATDPNMHSTNTDMSLSNSSSVFQHHAGHFTTMTNSATTSYFGAFGETEVQMGVDVRSGALGLTVGDACSREQRGLYPPRVPYAPQASSSLHNVLPSDPQGLSIPSDTSSLLSGFPTPSTRPHSHGATPEPGPSASLQAGSSVLERVSEDESTDAAIAKRRGKPRRQSASLYIYHCPHPTCTRVFRSEYTCRVHSGVHIPKPRKIIPCTQPGCRETFTRQHDRLRHEVTQHDKICEFSCTICHRFFSSAPMLEKHKCTAYRR